MVEPSTIKSKVSCCRENIIESVNVTEESESTKEFMEENGIFLCHELLNDVLATTTE
jgi:hypothetical protein